MNLPHYAESTKHKNSLEGELQNFRDSKVHVRSPSKSNFGYEIA